MALLPAREGELLLEYSAPLVWINFVPRSDPVLAGGFSFLVFCELTAKPIQHEGGFLFDRLVVGRDFSQWLDQQRFQEGSIGTWGY
jgi:hypothetical protein